MSVVKPAPIKETASHRAWLRVLVRPHPMAAAAVILSLVIAVLGMPDLIQAHTRVYSPLALCLVLVLWAGIVMVRQKVHLKPGTIDYALFAAFAYFTFRGPNAHTVANAVAGIGLFYLASELAKRREFFEGIISTFTGLTAAAALFGLAELVFFRHNLASDWGVADPDPQNIFPRIGSTLLHPAVFGAFLAMALPVCGYISFAGNSSKIRIFGMASTLLCMLSIPFTFAKGSWLVTSLMGAAFLLLLLRKRDMKKLIFMVVLAVVVLLPLIFLWQPVTRQTMIRLKSSVHGRMLVWGYAWQGIKQNPVFGVGQGKGPASMINMSNLLRKFSLTHAHPAAVDNYYLDYILEEGVVGFALFVLFLILLFYQGARGVFRPGAHRRKLVPVFAGLAAICLDALTFDALVWWSLFICFWVFAGLLNGLASEGRAAAGKL